MASGYMSSTWAGGELASNVRKPFDIIAVYNRAYQREKATFPEENGLFDIWRPLADALRTFYVNKLGHSFLAELGY